MIVSSSHHNSTCKVIGKMTSVELVNSRGVSTVQYNIQLTTAVQYHHNSLSYSTVRSDLPGFEPALPTEIPRDPKISTFNFFNSPETQIQLLKGSIQNQISSTRIRTRSNSNRTLVQYHSESSLSIHVELVPQISKYSTVQHPMTKITAI